MNEIIETEKPSFVQDIVLSAKDLKKEFTRVDETSYVECSHKRFLGKYVAMDESILIIDAEEIQFQDKTGKSPMLEDNKLIFKLGNKKFSIEEKDYILKVENLKQYFPIATNFFGKPTKFVHAVDGVSFKLEKGKTIGVVGESGCGKTTLGRTILKLYKKTAGDIYFEGKDVSLIKGKELRKLRCDMQLIFQDPYSSLSPKMTIGAIISEAVRAHHIVPKEEVREYTFQIMEKCGLQRHYYDRYPHEFSGGQRQRICIARALAVKPKLVVCDEPVSALDVSIQAQIINLLKTLQKEANLTYIFISHDLSVVKYISDTIAVMYLGSLVEIGSKKDIFESPLHPYTQALFSAVPIPDPTVKMHRIILEGDLPSPANPPKGCKFHTRCSHCKEICKEVTPQLMQMADGHFVACHLYQEQTDEEKEENHL